MGLHAKLHAIMKGVDRISKDRRNNSANYDYASEKAIKETMHNAFVQAGVIFKFEVLDTETMDLLNGQGKTVRITKIKSQYTFIDVETGEKETGLFVGSGNGRDDKGMYAAMTGSIKYILTSCFMIPTGDDPEDNRYDVNIEVPEKGNTQPKVEPKKKAPERKEKTAKGEGKEKTAGNVGKPLQGNKSPVSTAGQGGAKKSPSVGSPLLTEEQRNVVINAFEEHAHIDVWDLERVAGDCKSWTMDDKRVLLKKYTAITNTKNTYSKADFLEGKDVP